MSKRLYIHLFLITLAVIGLLSPRLQRADARQSPRQLTPFQSVSGSLGNGNATAQEWQFNGEAGQVISLVATPRSGDLDPVIELYSPQEQLLASNDNAVFDTLEARLEAYTLPETGPYRVRVYREGLEHGSTAGDYQLRLTMGFSLLPVGEALTVVTQLEQDTTLTQRELAELTTTDFYIPLEITLPQSQQPYHVEWRFFLGNIVWRFRHESGGDWLLAADDAQGNALRRARGEQFAGPGQNVRLAFRLQNNVFQVFANGRSIAILQVTESIVPTTPGRLSVLLATETPTPTTLIMPIRGLWLTTPYYSQEPVDAGAIPPTAPGERLYNYTATPLEAVDELRELGYIPSAPGSGVLVDIPAGYISSDVVGFRGYALVSRPFQNFVLSYTASVAFGPPETACGVLFRLEDGANFATVLFTPQRGVYFLQYQDGVPAASQLAIFSPEVLPGVGTTNHFTMIAIEDTGLLFVNGRLVGDIVLNPIAGPTLSHIVLATNESAYCLLNTVWLYSLD